MARASSKFQEQVNPTYAYAGAFVDELQRAGVRNVVICPGSRSTPLAMVFAAQAAMRTWMHIDERSAAYFGLGWRNRFTKRGHFFAPPERQGATFYPQMAKPN